MEDQHIFFKKNSIWLKNSMNNSGVWSGTNLLS